MKTPSSSGTMPRWPRYKHHRMQQQPLFQWGVLLATVALLVVGLHFLTTMIPFASDWEVYFRPITRGWLDGSLVLYEDTQWGCGFWNPPWLLWLLIPLAGWPTWVGWGLLVTGTILLIAWFTKEYPARYRWLIFASPSIAVFVVYGPVEIVPMLGIILAWLADDRPHLLGLALVLMAAKPQACFLVALWLLLHHRQRFRAMLVPLGVFLLSLIIHGWDWPLRWAGGPSILRLVNVGHNITPWRSIGLWMAPVAVALAWWVLRLPRTRRNLGALVAAHPLITLYLGSHSLIHVLTFSLLPLGLGWAFAGWLTSFSVFLRGWFGKAFMRLDFIIAAVLMIGYLLGKGQEEP